MTASRSDDGAALGIDLGERRIGVALAEAGTSVARALTTLQRGKAVPTDAATLTALLARHGASTLVVGLPYEASGTEGPQALATRTWVEALTPLLPPETAVTFQDERLTSHVAESRLGPMPRGRSGGPPTRAQRDAYRAKVDREAAAIILQDWLDTRTVAGPSSTRPPTPTMETPA